MSRTFLLALAVSLRLSAPASGEPLANSELQHYFDAKVRAITADSLRQITTRDQWETHKPKLRAQLFEMLGLTPLPEKTDLHPAITGTIERNGIVVEKLHFQSSPGLYVTGNFYLPKDRSGPLPTILYLCGHSFVRTNGISYGNKTAYQHHGAWFARNGYACLIIDTIEAGEIQGEHHGTYNKGMWWWNSRGYTPAGVEAWNCIRALDYLETRPEVDKTRFGVTGRSGGGAYTWWITALDDRIKVAAPVAGITDLQNQVVDGVVEGHCDCMFFVNTYRWDYPLVAALVAPRPLLLCNSDKDTIFPLDGVVRTHAFAKKAYDLYGASKNLGLLITEGPHQDTQDLQLPVFRWFNRHLKGEDPVIEMAAVKLFTPAELKVFDQLPSDEITTRIHETFVPRPAESSHLSLLRHKTFSAWPDATPIHPTSDTHAKLPSGIEKRTLLFDSEPGIPLRLIIATPAEPKHIELHILTPEDLPIAVSRDQASVFFQIDDHNSSSAEPRHRLQIKPQAATAFLIIRSSGDADPRKAVQIRRRYMLIGTTLDSMRLWDIARGTELLRSLPEFQKLPLNISASGPNSSNLLIALAMWDQLNPSAVFPESIQLLNPPRTDTAQPDYLNFSRFSSWNAVRQEIASTHPSLIIQESQPN